MGLFSSVRNFFSLPQLMLFSVYLNPTSFAGESSALLWFDDSKQAGRTLGPRLSAHSHGIVLNLLRSSDEHLVRISVAASKPQGGEEQVHTSTLPRHQRKSEHELRTGQAPGSRRICGGYGRELLIGASSACFLTEVRNTPPGMIPPSMGWVFPISHSLKQCPTAGS